MKKKFNQLKGGTKLLMIVENLKGHVRKHFLRLKQQIPKTKETVV